MHADRTRYYQYLNKEVILKNQTAFKTNFRNTNNCFFKMNNKVKKDKSWIIKLD